MKFNIIFEGAIVHAADLTPVAPSEFDAWVDRLMEELLQLGEGKYLPSIAGSSGDATLDIRVSAMANTARDAVFEGGSAIRTAAHAAGLVTMGFDIEELKVEGPERTPAYFLKAEPKELVPA